MPNKMVVDRQRSAQAVVAAGETHGERVAAALEALVKGQLRAGEKLPDVKLLIALATRGIAGAAEAMAAADEAHQRELGDDAGPRRRRDEAAAELYAALVELREIATGLLGGAAAATLRLTGTTPRDPVTLSGFAGEVIAALAEKPQPKSRVRGASFAAHEWKERLGEARKILDAALADVAREAREAEGTLTRRDAAMAEYDERFTSGAGFLSAIFRMAGERELAERVRPSSRRPGQTAAAEPEAPAAPPAPSAPAG